MKEKWTDIKNYENCYQVSNLGNIRSLPRNGTIKHIRILKPYIDNHGYYIVTLSCKNIKKTYKIHRIVAETFINNPNNKTQINHIDGNKLNNNINNLEWCTILENNIHARENNLKPDDSGINNANSKFTKKDINYIRNMYIKGDKIYGCIALANKFKVSKSTISYIINKKTYTGDINK